MQCFSVHSSVSSVPLWLADFSRTSREARQVDLVALVKDPDHVCCRYRLEAFRASLSRAGHALSLCVLPRRWWGRLALYPRLRGKNVILQRQLLPAWELGLLRRQARRLIYDFDDA